MMKYGGKPAKAELQQPAKEYTSNNQAADECVDSCYDWLCAADSMLSYIINCCGWCTNYYDWALEQD